MYGTAKRIKAGSSMLTYSHWLANNILDVAEILKKLVLGALSKKLLENGPKWFFNVIDADETEDVVGLYLQELFNWRVIKSSTYKNQRDFECEFRRKASITETAFMQVKSGNSITLDCQYYAGLVSSTSTFIYLFSTANEPYINEKYHENVIAIQEKDLFDFVLSSVELLPVPVLLKLNVA